MSLGSPLICDSELKSVLSKMFVSTQLNRSDLSFKLLKNSSERKNKQIKLESESNRIKITSTNFGQSSTFANFSNHFLAIIKQNEDGTKDKSVFIIRPEFLSKNVKIKSLNSSVDEAPNVLLNAASSNLDYKTSQNLLGEAFGTRKRKQAINSLEKNQIDVDKILTTSSKYISKSIDIKTSRSSTPIGMSSLLIDNGILPPYSPTATEFDLVFPDIIPSEMRRLLETIVDADTLFANNNFQKQYFDDIYKTCLGNFEKTFRLQFLYYLMRFSLLSEAHINNSDFLVSNLSGSSINFCEKLLDFYTEKIYDASGKFRFKFNNIKKDRLLSYVVLLNISLDPKLTCNVNVLSKVLKLPITKMLQCCKACGCKLLPATNSSKTYQDGKIVAVKIVSFSAPIVLPKSSRRN
jgi:hypothetical protein